jgi:hypothetical protein
VRGLRRLNDNHRTVNNGWIPARRALHVFRNGLAGIPANYERKTQKMPITRAQALAEIVNDMDAAIDAIPYYDREPINYATLENVENPAAYHAFLEIAEVLNLPVTGTLRINRPLTHDELVDRAIHQKLREMRNAAND